MSLTKKKDPHGYYVIPLNKKCLENEGFRNTSFLRDTVVEEYGDLVIVRTKSRSVVNKITRNRNLIKCIEYS